MDQLEPAAQRTRKLARLVAHPSVDIATVFFVQLGEEVLLNIHKKHEVRSLLGRNAKALLGLAQGLSRSHLGGDVADQCNLMLASGNGRHRGLHQELFAVRPDRNELSLTGGLRISSPTQLGKHVRGRAACQLA